MKPEEFLKLTVRDLLRMSDDDEGYFYVERDTKTGKLEVHFEFPFMENWSEDDFARLLYFYDGTGAPEAVE